MAKDKKNATEKTFWRFEEDNEWEGELWAVFFEASPEDTPDVRRLAKILRANDGATYTLREIVEMPESYDDGELEECEYIDTLEDGEEECGDCDYCGGSEGYYPAESERALSRERLTDALRVWKDIKNSDEDDPLYKLGLFY